MRKYKLITILTITSLLSCNKNLQNKNTEIPFENTKNQIILSVNIGKKGPYKMLLDTGVDPSVIDLKTARDLNLPVDTLQSGNASGRGNEKITVFPSSIENLIIMRKNYGTVESLAIDLNYLSKPLGMKLHGILGYSFLKDKIVRINYRKKTLQIIDSKEQLDKIINNKFFKSKFIFDDEDMIPLLDNLRLNNKPFIVSLDTGSSLNIQVYDHHINDFGIEIDSTNIFEIIGAQGKKKMTKSIIEKFKVGDTIFIDLETSISTIKNKEQLRMGNIGNKFLANFIVTFDYINKEIIFEKY